MAQKSSALRSRSRFLRKNRIKPRIPASRAKLLFALAAAMLAFFALIVQLFSVSIINGKTWTEKAMRQWSRTTYLKADRGKITDRDGTVLASSYTTYQVCVNPQNIQVDDRERIANVLSTYLEMDYDTVLAKMSKTRIKRGTQNNETPTYELLSQVKIKDQVDKEVISQLNAMQLGTGVSYYADVKRDYPESGYYGQLLGFTNVDGDGQTGVELTYNSYLADDEHRTAGDPRKRAAGGLHGQQRKQRVRHSSEPADRRDLCRRLLSHVRFLEPAAFRRKGAARAFEKPDRDRYIRAGINLQGRHALGGA